MCRSADCSLPLQKMSMKWSPRGSMARLKGPPMRLDKYISHATGYSRREVKKILRLNLIQVNGTVIREPEYTLSGSEQILFDDRPLQLQQTQYLMLHKPVGYVCSHEDSGLRVFDLLPGPLKNLSIAGRLDKDASGLLLLSDDGDWIHRITSPKHACEKVYRVELKHPYSLDEFQAVQTRFTEGLMLNGEDAPTLPARCQQLSATEYEVVLQEGRYHQVKRMFAACGNRVEKLHRRQVGCLELPPSLSAGSYRPLTSTEVEQLRL